MTKQLRAELSLIGATVIWGTGYPLMTLALRNSGSYTYVAFRSMLAAIVFIVFQKRLLKIGKSAIRGVFTLAMGNILQVQGLLYTTPSKSSFITNLSIIFVLLIIAVVYKKLPGKSTVLVILLSVIGLLFMSSPNGKWSINKGDILTLLCSICYSFEILLVDIYYIGCTCRFATLNIQECDNLNAVFVQ